MFKGIKWRANLQKSVESPQEYRIALKGLIFVIIRVGVGMAGTITVTCAPPTCTTPGGVTSAMITSTTAKISWSAVVGATKYQIQYRPVGTPTWLKKNSTTNISAFAKCKIGMDVSMFCG